MNFGLTAIQKGPKWIGNKMFKLCHTSNTFLKDILTIRSLNHIDIIYFISIIG